MKDLFDLDVWRAAVAQATTNISASAIEFGGKALLALVILAVGVVVARVVQAIASRTLARLGADKVLKRARVADSLAHAGVLRPLSEILGRVLFWLVVLTFGLLAVDALGLKALATTIDRLLVFIPKIAGATVLLFVGLILGRLTRDVIASGGAFGSPENAVRLGGVTNVAIVVTAAVLAVEQLGVQTEILASVTTALVATFGLSMGVAFALGARGVVGHVLAGHFLRQRFRPGEEVEIDGQFGIVTQVGSVDTLVQLGDDTLSLPNSALLDTAVKRRGSLGAG